ncbi:MAG: sulfatase [Phycisphaerae bacterium]|nr:sulfatase [Phycisphaerae bacterium]
MKLSRRNFLQVTGLTLAGVLGGCGNMAEKMIVKKRPNLVFVFPDQFRASAMGFVGKEPVITPNLDRFAREAKVLTDACSTRPVCSPYRAMLFSGNYYIKNGVWTNCNSKAMGIELRKSDVTMTDMFHKAGYYQGYIGKWHLEYPQAPYVKSGNNGGEGKMNWDEWTSPDRRHGVDFWYAYNTWDHHFQPHYWTNDSTRDSRVEIRQWSPEHEADKAIEFIKNEDGKMRDGDKPFVVFVANNPPHTAYSLVPDKYKEMYADKEFDELNTLENIKPGSKGQRMAKAGLKDYFACITGVDDNFGRILDTLKEQDLDDDTIVVFTSDHGNCVGANDYVTKNNPTDQAFLVPFIIRWPGKIKAGTDDLLIAPPDIYPTLAGLMGIKEYQPGGLEGADYSDALLGKKCQRPSSALYAVTEYSNTPFSQDDKDLYNMGERGVRTGRYTLVVKKTMGKNTRVILTDNQADPFQLKNIAMSQPELVKKLTEEELIPWLVKIGDDWVKRPMTEKIEYPMSMAVLRS